MVERKTTRLPKGGARVRPERFAERHGGLIVAIAFHFALFTLLANITISTVAPRRPEPPPIKITLTPPPEPTPQPQSAQPKPPSPPRLDQLQATTAEQAEPTAEKPDPESKSAAEAVQFTPAQATVAEQPEGEDAEPSEPQPAEPDPVEQEIAAATVQEMLGEKIEEAPVEETETDEPVDEEIEKYLTQQREKASEANRQMSREGSKELEERLKDAAMQLKAKNWNATTKGLEEGILRTLDTSGYPPSVEEKVLGRYGIKIMLQHLDGGSSNYDFLNQARTRGGTYYNRVGKGYYKVFSFGPEAVARMMQLEYDELVRRGLDPNKTRIVEVEFGIVETTQGYDLGIKKMEAVKIEE